MRRIQKEAKVGMRRWVKILPYFIVERVIRKFLPPVTASLDGMQVLTWELGEGVFYSERCKPQKEEKHNEG